MKNVHTPERLQGESFDDYRKRRAQSNAINKANRLIGRGGISSRKSLRDSMRQSGAMGKKTRAYVALCAACASKRVPKWEGDRDKFGAYTLVGGSLDRETGEYIKRKWLAGISAQRGY